MGIIHAAILLSNPMIADQAPMEVKALVDSGAVHLVLPEHVALQLGLKELEKREVTLADGSRRFVSYAGPVKISFKNRNSFTGALIMGNIPLLGAIAMEDLDLVIHPFLQKLDVNPESPNVCLRASRWVFFHLEPDPGFSAYSYTPSNNLCGSSRYCFTRIRKLTDSRPSMIRWS